MMGVPRIPARLCAFNPDHGEATRTAHMDGRAYPACAACCEAPALDVKAGPKRPRRGGIRTSQLRGPIIAALGVSPGSDFATLARFCGVPLGGSKYETMRRLVCDMVADGAVERSGNHRGPRFYLRGEMPS